MTPASELQKRSWSHREKRSFSHTGGLGSRIPQQDCRTAENPKRGFLSDTGVSCVITVSTLIYPNLRPINCNRMGADFSKKCFSPLLTPNAEATFASTSTRKKKNRSHRDFSHWLRAVPMKIRCYGNHIGNTFSKKKRNNSFCGLTFILFWV